MKQQRFDEAQIIGILKQQESGVEDTAGTVFSADGNDDRPGPRIDQFINLNPSRKLLLVPPQFTTDHGDLMARHLETINVAFLDGHVKAMKLEKLCSINAKGVYPYFSKILD